MKNDKTILKITVCFMTVIFVFLFGELYIKDAADNLLPAEPGYKNFSEVTVYVGNKSGRGVIFEEDDEKIIILTSKHLFLENWQGVAEFGNHTTAVTDVVFYYNNMDAALIKVEKEGINRLVKVPKICDAAGYFALKEGSDVYYSENIFDEKVTSLTGKLTKKEEDIGLEQKVGLFEGNVVPGMSGEGVYDEKGRLLGIIVASDQTYGAFIPAYILEAEASIGG